MKTKLQTFPLQSKDPGKLLVGVHTEPKVLRSNRTNGVIHPEFKDLLVFFLSNT